MSPAKAKLPPSLGAGFLRSTAIAAGVSPRRLRHADLETPFRGVRRRRDIAPATVPLAVPEARISSDHSSLLHPLARRRAEHLERARLYNLVAADGVFFCG